MLKMITVFFVCSLINVMLSTVKTILTVRSTKAVATIINALTYGFYAIVVKQLATFSLPVTVTITILTNIVGVYLSMFILEKFEKDKTWMVTITVPIEYLDTLQHRIRKNKIGCNWTQLSENKGKIEVFTDSKAESHKLREILKDYPKVKGHIFVQENAGQL